MLRYHFRKSENCLIERRLFQPTGTLKEQLEVLCKNQYDNWNAEWRDEHRGRITYQFFPDPAQRITAKWIEPDYYTTQLMSGHGNIKSKLDQLGLSESDRCQWGQPQTTQHIIFDCPHHDEYGSSLRNAVLEQEWVWQPPLWVLVTPDCYRAFKQFAKSTLTNKEEWDRL